MDETRTAKADVIAYALGLAGIKDPCSCIMVGDRKHDILGAKAQSMASMGVLFGYGSLSELEEAGRLPAGTRAMLVGFGGGLTWGGALVEIA